MKEHDSKTMIIKINYLFPLCGYNYFIFLLN